jgi:hypothetical protein
MNCGPSVRKPHGGRAAVAGIGGVCARVELALVPTLRVGMRLPALCFAFVGRLNCTGILRRTQSVRTCVPTRSVGTRCCGESETEEGGFEPPRACALPVFKTGAIDHSATPPSNKDTRQDGRVPCGIRNIRSAAVSQARLQCVPCLLLPASRHPAPEGRLPSRCAYS